MLVLRGSPIFGVRFCDTGVGVARDDVAIKFWPWFFSCSSSGLKQEFQHSSLCLPVYFICSPFLCLGGLQVGVQFLFSHTIYLHKHLRSITPHILTNNFFFLFIIPIPSLN